jgi:hypothetical protein
MSKKLYSGLAPLVVIASFAMTPAAAQATPHYYVNQLKLAEGEKVPVIAWGQLTLASEPEGKVAVTQCENAAGGFIENPVGGGPGAGQTTRWATWNCTNAECPPGEVELAPGLKVEKEFEVVSPPQDLPWPNTLTGVPGAFKLNSTGVVVELGCVGHKVTRAQLGEGGPVGPKGQGGENEQFPLAPFVTCKTTATNLQDPETHNGTNQGNNQSTLIFNQPAGSGLTCANGTLTGRTSQSLKDMGYTESQLITTKNS